VTNDKLKNLCPSTDIPESGWYFSYTIYEHEGCAGDELNPLGDLSNPHNFVCYDSSDLFDRHDANKSVDDWLTPGCNYNQIICSTLNAQKIFDFDTCARVTDNCPLEPDSSVQCVDKFILDCGCRRESSTAPCTCYQGFQESDLTDGCVFTQDCLIDCTDYPAPPAG
jgi:hypothetical protein